MAIRQPFSVYTTYVNTIRLTGGCVGPGEAVVGRLVAETRERPVLARVVELILADELRRRGALRGERRPGLYPAVGSSTAPTKSTVPDRRSRMANRKGRSTRKVGGPASVTPIPTPVAAAASVPSSFTCT